MRGDYHGRVGKGAYRKGGEGRVSTGAATGDVGLHICGKEREEDGGKVGEKGDCGPRRGEWLNREVKWPIERSYDRWREGG